MSNKVKGAYAPSHKEEVDAIKAILEKIGVEEAPKVGVRAVAEFVAEHQGWLSISATWKTMESYVEDKSPYKSKSTTSQIVNEVDPMLLARLLYINVVRIVNGVVGDVNKVKAVIEMSFGLLGIPIGDPTKEEAKQNEGGNK